MIFITTLLKNTLTLNCYLLTGTAFCIKSNQKMFLKNFLNASICFISVTIQKIFNPTNKKDIGKMKEVFERKAISQFVGLMSRIHSIKTIDGKEFNMAKVNSKSKYFDWV